MGKRARAAATLGRRVTEARAVLGITQVELATRLRLTPKEIDRIEGGHRRVDPELLEQISTVLRRPAAWFRSEPGPPAKTGSIGQRVFLNRDEIRRIAQEHGCATVRIFGSVARGEAGAASDVDLLVEFQAGRVRADLASLVLRLEELLGCPVHIVSEEGLGPARESALRDGIVL